MLPRGIWLHRFLHEFGFDSSFLVDISKKTLLSGTSSSPSGFATMTRNFGGARRGRRQGVATVKTDVMSLDFVGVPCDSLQGSLQAWNQVKRNRAAWQAVQLCCMCDVTTVVMKKDSWIGISCTALKVHTATHVFPGVIGPYPLKTSAAGSPGHHLCLLSTSFRCVDSWATQEFKSVQAFKLNILWTLSVQQDVTSTCQLCLCPSATGPWSRCHILSPASFHHEAVHLKHATRQDMFGLILKPYVKVIHSFALASDAIHFCSCWYNHRVLLCLGSVVAECETVNFRHTMNICYFLHRVCACMSARFPTIYNS